MRSNDVFLKNIKIFKVKSNFFRGYIHKDFKLFLPDFRCIKNPFCLNRII